MNLQKQFWDLVEKGSIEVIHKQVCVDALNDTPNMDLNDFILEAVEYGWIKETA